MGRTSLQKGKRGEREAAKAVIEHLGLAARRGRQYCGSPDSPDIVVDLPGVHFEVKRVERLSLYKALKEAIEDAEEKVPVVLHRSNRQDWVAILRLQDLKRFAKLLIGGGGDGDSEGRETGCVPGGV